MRVDGVAGLKRAWQQVDHGSAFEHQCFGGVAQQVASTPSTHEVNQHKANPQATIVAAMDMNEHIPDNALAQVR